MKWKKVGRIAGASQAVSSRMTKARLASAGLCLACLVHGPAAFAQSDAGDPADVADSENGGASETGGMTEILVTAQRRSENLQNVPIAVTALSSDDLAQKQVLNTSDLSFAVPNMYSGNAVGQGSANVYFIRGLGQTNAYPTFEPQVGTYVDDIYMARMNANNYALFGVSQIQVLNGPQGTLFGRNSTGGAVVISLKKPAKDFGVTGEIAYGSYDRLQLQLAVDLPISDEVLSRTALFRVTDNGNVKNVTTGERLNDVHNYGIRQAFTFLPEAIPGLEWNVSADYIRNDASNIYGEVQPNGDRISYTGFSKKGGQLRSYLTGVKGDLGLGALVKSYGLTSNLKLDLGSGTLNIISSARQLRQQSAADYPNPSLGAISVYDTGPTGQYIIAQNTKNKQITQEVKWNSGIGDVFSYTAGVYYLYEKSTIDFGIVQNTAVSSGVPGLTSRPTVLGDLTTTNSTSSLAAFAQGDLTIAKGLTLTVGGRFTHEIKEVEAAPNQVGKGFTTADLIAQGYLTKLQVDKFTPRAVLQYQATPDLMLFASATRGFQGGGWNGLATSARTYNNFDPETVWAYEAGFRSQFPSQRIRFNATFFYQDVDGFQQRSFDATVSAFSIANVASMRSYGLEAHVDWEPIDRLTLSGDLGLLHARFYNLSDGVIIQQQLCLNSGSNCNAGIVTPTGAIGKPTYSPPVSLTGSAAYTFDVGNVEVTPNVAVSYKAKQWIISQNTPDIGEAKAYTLVNAGIRFKPLDLPVSLTLECKNCFDIRYPQNNLYNLIYYNYPRTYTARLGFEF